MVENLFFQGEVNIISMIGRCWSRWEIPLADGYSCSPLGLNPAAVPGKGWIIARGGIR